MLSGTSIKYSPRVTAADQKQINAFARLHQKLTELKENVDSASKDLQNLADAADELLLLSSDVDYVPFKMGLVYVHYDVDTMSEKLETMQEELQSDIENMRTLSQSMSIEMAKLKTELYGKFGDSINLETDKDD